MRATENQGSFLNRISIRRNQVVSMDGNHEQDLEDIEIFQRHVADRFSSLLDESSSSLPNSSSNQNLSSCDSNSHSSFNSSSSSILSIAFLRKLLDAFLCCEAEFKALLIIGREPSQVSRPPLDRLVPDLLDRSVKALDICNAVTHGVDAVRHCQKLAEIAASALASTPIGDGQARRAGKALTSLAAAISFDDKEDRSVSSATRSTERSWSLGRKGSSAAKDRGAGQLRSLWLGMAKGWSASKQLQAMSANMAPPRGAAEAGGLAQPVYVMSAVTVFVMWTLVAAIPCQERTALAAAAAHLAAPRQLSWAQPMVALQERIAEEWKRKEKRGTAGLLDEVQRMERAAVALSDFAETFRFPGEADKADEAAAHAAELGEACRRMEEGLAPLQRQIREVFHKIVKTRTEVLEVLDQGGKFSTPTM